MERFKSVGKAVLLGIAISEVSKLAFTQEARKEIGRLDKWTCQGVGGEPCVMESLYGKPASFKDGFSVTAAHYPEDHHHSGSGYHDPDISNGRILCCIDHACEEHDRGNDWGAKKLLEKGIYKTRFLPHQEKLEQVYISLEEAKEIREQAREMTGVTSSVQSKV